MDVFAIDAIRAWLVRSWFYCNGGWIFQKPHDGIELAADGHWYFLDLEQGELVRRSGFDGGGSWQLTDVSSVNGPGPFSAQLDFFQGGMIPSFVSFGVDPVKLHVSAGGGTSTDYVAVDAAGE